MRSRAENTNTTIKDTVSYFDYRFNFPANSVRGYNVVNQNKNTLGTSNENKNIIGAQRVLTHTNTHSELLTQTFRLKSTAIHH